VGRIILHHAALPHRGGAVRVARLLMQAQAQVGLDTRLSFEVPENDPEALGAANATSAASAGLPTAPADLGRSLAELPPDACLHLHTSTDWSALLSGLVPLVQGRRLLLTLHDATPLTGGCAYPLDCPHFPLCAEHCPRNFSNARTRQAQVAALLRQLGPTVVSPSRWLADLCRQTLPEMPVRILPNGVPWPELSALPTRLRARAALGVDPGARLALFAAHGGARAAYKSGSRWLEYWQQVRGKLPQAQAFAVGGDEASCQDGLTTWPYVDRHKLRLLMRAADVLLYPTLADNHPLVLLEAASLELPVVSFAVGGVPEIVTHGATGLIIPACHGLDGFCASAVALLADAALSRRLGQTARARGAKRFTLERMAADYAELLG